MSMTDIGEVYKKMIHVKNKKMRKNKLTVPHKTMSPQVNR
jgi:hypothetical protein